MKRALLPALVFAALLAGCADSEVIVVPPEPGFVGIDDRAVTANPPILTVTYYDGATGRNVDVWIISEKGSDGHVSYDPVQDVYFSMAGPDTLFFGVDFYDPNRREYRAFLDFPLDGSTGQPVVPSGAPIVSATLRIFLTEVSFAPVVPCYIDLVQYPLTGPTAADFASPYLAWRALDIYDSYVWGTLDVPVTLLMDEAQRLDLPDFQVRFLIR